MDGLTGEQPRYNARGRNAEGAIGRVFSPVYGGILRWPENSPFSATTCKRVAGHDIDFTIGDYNTAIGVDLLVERRDKGFTGYWWVELVSTPDKLTQWPRRPDGFNAIVSYALGNTPEMQTLSDGRSAKLGKKDVPGRYALLVGTDTREVYVLKEILAQGS